MPYKVYGSGDEWCVHKVNADGSRGERVASGCYSSKSEADNRSMAMNANVEKESGEETPVVNNYTVNVEKDVGEEDETHEKMYYGSYSATSFEELDSEYEARKMREHVSIVTNQFHMLASNIFDDPEIEDKGAALVDLVREYEDRISNPPEMMDKEMHDKAAIKRENGMDFPSRDYAFVPDPERPSTWRLRLTEAPGKVTVKQLGRAAAALSSGGFRGNRAQIPNTALSAIKRRIRAEYERLGVKRKDMPASVKESSQFITWHDKSSGKMRWLAIYSNKFRDDDVPSEIISEESHKGFVEMVDKGIAPYPELWLAHLPFKWGVADMVDYVEGFAIASGTVTPGYEHIAKNVSEMDCLVSHGMPRPLLVYDDKRKDVIRFHITKEISPLPRSRAANQRTGFIVLEGAAEMSNWKKEFLEQAGVPPEKLDDFESMLKQMREDAEADGIEFKETEGQSEEESEPESETGLDLDPLPEPKPKSTPQAAQKETPAETQELEEEPEEEPEPVPAGAPDALTKDVFAGVVRELWEKVDARMGAVEESISDMQSAVKELQVGDAEKIARTKEVTPTLSLESILSDHTPIGHEKSRVDGRTKEGQDGPKETDPQSATPITNIGFLDEMINNTQKPAGG